MCLIKYLPIYVYNKFFFVKLPWQPHLTRGFFQNSEFSSLWWKNVFSLEVPFTFLYHFSVLLLIFITFWSLLCAFRSFSNINKSKIATVWEFLRCMTSSLMLRTSTEIFLAVLPGCPLCFVFIAITFLELRRGAESFSLPRPIRPEKAGSF